MRATQVSQNPKYGWPSAKKLRARINAWRIWASGMAMLRQIHEEEKEKFDAISQASNRLAAVKRYV